MKKYISLFSIIFLTTLFSLTTFSCNWEFEDPAGEKRPDIDNTKNSIKITAHKISDDIEYINIYRQLVSEANSAPVCIGMMYPSEYDEKNDSYMFEDFYLEAGKTYKYKLRYYDKVTKEYQPTEWTEEQKALFGEKQTYLSTDANLKYENDSLILEGKYLSKDLVQEGFYPAVVLKAGNDSQVFAFEKTYLNAEENDSTDENENSEDQAPGDDGESDDKYDAFVYEDTDSAQYYIGLLKTLPANFFNKEVEIVGIVAQKIDTKKYPDSTEKTKRIYWLEPETLITKKGDTTKTSFVIESQAGTNGYDYTYSNIAY